VCAQAYSYTTVTAFYKRMLSQFGVDNEGLCASPEADPSFLETLAKLSVAQNELCPATSVELLKQLLERLRLAGDKMLHLSYTFTMMVANFIAAAVTLGHGDPSAYMDSAGRYMSQMFEYIMDIMEELLKVFTYMLMYMSTIGRVIATIVDVLCQIFNWLLEFVIADLWCRVIRPCVIGIVIAIRAVAFFSSDTVKAMNDLLDTIGSGSPTSCAIYYKTTGHLQCPLQIEANYNQTSLRVQPMATMCWSKAQQGGGIYSGVASRLLMSCTSSDTCALEPLRYDSGLVYCGSCPAAEVGGGFQFGCDVYLQRCVCGTQTYAKTECLTNADCQQQPGAKCSVASSLDGLRASYLSVECSACGARMGLSPICMLDGQGAAGICGCANIVHELLSCRNVGQRATLGTTAGGLCPVVTQTARQGVLAQSPVPQAILLLFGDVAITYCRLGQYANLCLNLQIPLSGAGESGVQQGAYVVLLSLLVSTTPGRRRLLSVESMAQAPGVVPYALEQWVLQEGGNRSQPPSHLCAHTARARDAAKRCLYWAQLGAFVVEHFNLSHSIREPFALFSADTGPLFALPLLAPHMAMDPELRHFILAHTVPYGRTVLEMSRAVGTFFLTTGRQQKKPVTGRPRRALLQEQQEQQTMIVEEGPASKGDWEFNCTSVQVPVAKLATAFWDTVSYYEGGRDALANASVTSTCDVSQGLYNCLGYSLPPAHTRNNADQWLEVLLYVPTLGAGPNRLVDAFLSPIPHDEAERNDLLTGSRLLQDMGVCNFTRLTQGPVKLRSFMPMFLFLLVLFTVVSYTCMPLSVCTSLLWLFLFPVVLFWAMYNVSPLCWPMIPPRFVYDVHQELNALIPTQVTVPRYLVRPRCTVAGKLSDGTYDPTCFLSCSEPPFLFKSWQVASLCVWFVSCIFLMKGDAAGHTVVVGMRGEHEHVRVHRTIAGPMESIPGPGVVSTLLRLRHRVHSRGRGAGAGAPHLRDAFAVSQRAVFANGRSGVLFAARCLFGSGGHFHWRPAADYGHIQCGTRVVNLVETTPDLCI
jgi:hypothetical protein